MNGVCVCDSDGLSAFGEDTSSDDYDYEYEHEYTGSYLASEATRELGRYYFQKWVCYGIERMSLNSGLLTR